MAALVQRCQISCYEFSSLAFLAYITHFASLLVLRQYFRENKEKRNIRVAGMTVKLILLTYKIVAAAASSAVHGSTRVQYVMGNFPSESDILSMLATLFLTVPSYL